MTGLVVTEKLSSDPPANGVPGAGLALNKPASPCNDTKNDIHSKIPPSMATDTRRRSDHIINSHSRKSSTPLAPPFMVSAPGKVIIFGEHAVVHGKSAMAATISLRSYLLVTTLPAPNRTITLNLTDIDLRYTWNIDSLPWDTFKQPAKKKYYYDTVTSLDKDLINVIQSHVDSVSKDKPDAIRKIHHVTARAFLYMFLSLSSPSCAPAIYSLRSTVPIGAGLGSSASICVCLSTALLLQARVLSGPHQDQPLDECALQIERINRWAFVGEMCIHGNPSGVDNTVSSGGKAVLFRRNDYARPPSVAHMPHFPELRLWLVNSKQPRSTAAEVAKVGKLRKDYPDVAEALLDGIDRITASAHELISAPEYCMDDISSESIDRFGQLLRMNHGLLVSLGVSHPRLERIRELVDHEGIGWTKLTGAGGGGCAITLLRKHIEAPALDKLEKQFGEENLEKYDAVVGGDGVGVLFPAVIYAEDDHAIDLDPVTFENAAGRDNVEKIVGMSKVPGARTGEWQFWKSDGGSI